MTSTSTDSRFALPADALTVLGSYAAAPTGPLSVLSARPPSSDTVQSLVSAGVLDRHGRPTPSFAPLLRVLATPTGIAQLDLTDGETLIELQVHSAPSGSVSVVSTADGLEVASPAEVDRVVRTLTEHLGYSLLPGLSLSVHLDRQDALAFAAIVDHHRRRWLESLLSGTPPSPAPPDDDTIWSLLNVDDPRWLVPLVLALADTTPDVGTVARGRGLGTDVVDAARRLATRFAVFDRVLTLTTVGAPGGDEPVASRMACAQAGVHDLLVMEAGTDGIGFATLPSALILARIATMLSDPAGEIDAALRPPAGFCTQCGTAFDDSDRFCTNCGAPRL